MDWNNRIGRRVRLRDLHILLAVAQHGSMGRAAAALSISQPVISKAISELEAALGVRLFDRGAQGVLLTPYGHAMAQCGRAVFDELNGGVKAIEFLGDPTGGHLQIGCTESAAIGIVPIVIEELCRRHPRLNFHVMTSDPESLAELELPQRRIELAISATPARLPQAIEAMHLFEDSQVVMAGAHSSWARRRNLKLADLLEAPWVLPPLESPARQDVVQAFRALGLEPPEPKVATISRTLCYQLLATGQYLSILPRAATLLARHLPLRPLKVDLPGIKRSIAIMTLKNRTLSPLARLFIETACFIGTTVLNRRPARSKS